MSDQKITSDLRLFHEILNDEKYYEVPDFQRSYSWEDSNLNDFLMDIENVKVTKGKANSHFMGAIVLYNNGFRDGHEDANVSRLSIIDGQQRITTTLLLLCALRDVAFMEYEKLNKNKIPNIKEEKNLEIEIEKFDGLVKDIGDGLYPRSRNGIFREGSIEEFRYTKLGYSATGTSDDVRILEVLLKGPKGNFSLWKDLRSDLDSVVKKSTNKNSSGGQQNILYAYNKFFNYIKNNINTFGEEGEKHTYLKVLMNKIDNLRYVTILLDDMYSAYNIFMTLNDRGLELSNSDLIKSHIIRGLHGKPMESFLMDWNNLNNILEGSIEYKNSYEIGDYLNFSGLQDVNVEPDKFFIAFAYLHAFEKPKGQKSITTKNIFRCYEDSLTDVKKIQGFVGSMVQEAKIYRLAYDPYCYYMYNDSIFSAGDKEKEGQFAKVAKSLSALKFFKIRQHVIFTYLLLRLAIVTPSNMDKPILDLKYVAGVLKDLENFHFIYNILLKVSGNTFTKSYENAVKGISHVLNEEFVDLDDTNKLQGEVCKKIKILISELNRLLKAQEVNEDKFVKLFTQVRYAEKRTLKPEKDRMSYVEGEYFDAGKGTESSLIIRYILSKYQPNVHGSIEDPLTIEHIYPHSKNENLDEQVDIINSIGNLMLIPRSVNNRLKNKDIAKKINDLQVYYGSSKNIFNVIEKWSNPNESSNEPPKKSIDEYIKDRAKEMAENGYRNIWKMSPRAFSDTDGGDDSKSK